MLEHATTIIVGRDVAVAEWVRTHIPGVSIEFWPSGYHAIGFAIGSELIAGAVYCNFTWPTIEISLASISPRWASRRNLAALAAYPFLQLNCKRLGATTRRKNQPVRAFLCRLGFQEEGIARCAYPDDDAVIYGMLREECRWLPRDHLLEGGAEHVIGEGRELLAVD